MTERKGMWSWPPLNLAITSVACTLCKVVKERNLDNFPPSKQSRSGFSSWCRDCCNKTNKARTDKMREEDYAGWADMCRNRNLSRYKLTPEKYDGLFNEQGRACVICGTTENQYGHRFSIDHDHSCCNGAFSCGKCYRAILCKRCNSGIGLFVDNADLLRKAAEYIDKGTRNIL